MPQGSDILEIDIMIPEKCIFIPVNTVGVMGKGLAKDFKKVYPILWYLYSSMCSSNILTIGNPCTIFTQCNNHIGGSVVFFPTKENWKKPSNLSWIKSGLIFLATSPSKTKWRKMAKKIHMPKLGCGCGGLDWNDVRPLIEQFAEMMPDSEIFLYE